MSNLEKYLADVKARCDAATEWYTTYSDFSGSILVDNENPRLKTHLGFECPKDVGILMAHARTDVPRLLEMVRIVIKNLEDHGCFCEESHGFKNPAYECMGHQIQREWEIARGDDV